MKHIKTFAEIINENYFEANSNDFRTYKLILLYKDGAGNSHIETSVVNTIDFPEIEDVNEITVGSEIEMGEYNTPSEEEWFKDGSFDDKYDHNILRVLLIDRIDNKYKDAKNEAEIKLIDGQK